MLLLLDMCVKAVVYATSTVTAVFVDPETQHTVQERLPWSSWVPWTQSFYVVSGCDARAMQLHPSGPGYMCLLRDRPVTVTYGPSGHEFRNHAD